MKNTTIFIWKLSVSGGEIFSIFEKACFRIELLDDRQITVIGNVLSLHCLLGLVMICIYSKTKAFEVIWTELVSIAEGYWLSPKEKFMIYWKNK